MLEGRLFLKILSLSFKLANLLLTNREFILELVLIVFIFEGPTIVKQLGEGPPYKLRCSRFLFDRFKGR